MSRYLARVAQRTGMLDAGARRKQLAAPPAVSHSSELHHHTMTRVVAPELPPGNATSVQADAPPEPSRQPHRSDAAGPGRYSLDNHTVKNESAGHSNPEAKKLIPAGAEPARQSRQERSVDYPNVAYSADGDTLSPVPDGPLTPSVDNDAAGVSSLRFPPRSSGPSTRIISDAPGESARDDSMPSIKSQTVPPNSPAAESLTKHSLATADSPSLSTSTVDSVPYTSSLSASDGPSAEASHQNVEIRIGSVTMEVHQEQPAVTTISPPPKSTDNDRTQSKHQSSGFRPSRHYLRGI